MDVKDGHQQAALGGVRRCHIWVPVEDGVRSEGGLCPQGRLCLQLGGIQGPVPCEEPTHKEGARHHAGMLCLPPQLVSAPPVCGDGRCSALPCCSLAQQPIRHLLFIPFHADFGITLASRTSAEANPPCGASTLLSPSAKLVIS